MTTPQIKYPTRVRRIRVLWQEGKWQILKEIEIPSMTLPRSLDLPEAGGEQGISGFWYEATDDNGRVYYRRGMDDPARSEVELFEEDGSMSWARIEQPEVLFDVLIPDLPEIQEVRFFSEATEPVAVLKIQHRDKGGKNYGNK